MANSLPPPVRRTLMGLLLLCPLVCALGVAGLEGETLRKLLSNLAQVCAAILAAVCLTLAAAQLKRRGDPAADGWTWIAAGAWVWFSGALVFMLMEMLITQNPYPGPPDYLFLLHYPLVMIGLARMPAETLTRSRRRDAALDLSAFGLVAVMVIWNLDLSVVIQDLAESGSPSVLISLAYTLFDTILLMLLFAWLVRRFGRGRQFMPMLLLTTGGFALILADVLQTYVSMYTEFTSGTFLDLGWTFYSVCGGLAGLCLMRPESTAANEDASPRAEFGRSILTLTLTYVWIALVLFLLAWASAKPHMHQPEILWAGACGVILLIATRQIRTMTELGRLNAALDVSRRELEVKVAERTGELKALTEAACASEQKFRGIFDSSFALLGLLAPDGCVLEINRTAMQMIDCKREDVLGRLFWDTPWWNYSTELQARLREAIARAANGEHVSMDVEHPTPDGTLRQIEFSLRPLRDQAGKITLLVPEGHDVTERRKAQEEICRSEERLRLALEGTRDAVWDRDLITHEAYFSPRWYEMLGYDRNSHAQTLENCTELIHPDDRERLRAASHVAIANHTECSEECRIMAADGSWRWILINGRTTAYDAEGRATRMSGSARDITERKRAEEAMRESEALRKRAFESSRTAQVIIDAVDMAIVDANPAALCLYGFETMGDVLGKGPLDVSLPVQPDGQPSLEKARGLNARAVADGEVLFEWRHRRPNGEEWDAEVHLISFPSGERMFLQCALTDITQRKQAEEERQRLQAQLTQAQKMEGIGRLAGGVAHDFNNMLQSILGFSELALRRLRNGGDIVDCIKQVQHAGNRSADLTRQLLAFARQQSVTPLVLKLNDSIEGVLKMLRRLIGEDIDLLWQPGPNLWPVRMDPSQIDQILVNLAVNARDALHDSGKITLETSNTRLDADFCRKHLGVKPGDYVLLTFSDTGCGMDPDTAAMAFEPFFTTKEQGKGTGLGLSTVYGIVKQNEGAITLYSEPGIGTTFRIYLPRCVREGDAPTRIGDIQEAPGRGEIVLLVEDDPMILGIVELMLRESGYQVLAAHTPQEALELASLPGNAIDVLLTDVIMPGMNGRELVEQVLAIRPALRHVYMSGYTADVIANRGVVESGLRLIQKPFTRDRLATALREALDAAN